MPLTPAQLATLKAHIAANTATINGTAINALPHTGDNAFDIAVWYNADAAGPFVVWRDVSMEVILGLITYANMTPLDAVPSVTSLPASPTTAQNATYNNQMAALHTWNCRANLCQAKQFNLQNLTIGRDTAPMKRTNYRAALQDCLTNIPAGASGANLAANWTGVRDSAKFNATRAEQVFATGTGTTAVPADLGFEGTVTTSEIQTAWDLP